LPLDGDLWTEFRRMDRLFMSGRREDVVAAVKSGRGLVTIPLMRNCCDYALSTGNGAGERTIVPVNLISVTKAISGEELLC